MSDQEMIRIEGLTFTYPGAKSPVLHDISLTIERGDFIAIVGSNGSAKSTLCKAINGLIPHFYVGDFAGKVTVNGLCTIEHGVAALARHVGYVYQDFENQLVRPTVLDDASFVPLNYGLHDYKERGMKAINTVGLDANPNEFIWELSGGQKHLLALAGAIALSPEIIVIDEPVAQLDPQHAREIYDTLRRFNEDLGMTIIVIEHHTEFIADYCKHVVLMSQGKVIWKKGTQDALSEVEDLVNNDVFPPQVTQAASRIEALSGRLPITLYEAEAFFASAPQLMFNDKNEDQETSLSEVGYSKPIIEIEKVGFSYKTIDRKKKQILRELSLSFYPGERVALVGNNGAGKSSLLRLITGITRPENGMVSLKGIDTCTTSPERLADMVTYICQNPEDMFIEDSIRKDIEFFLKARQIADYQDKVDRVLSSFNLTHIQDCDGRLLSGGQQRRASLAIGVAMNPSVILLDEPTANLDIATRKDVARMLQVVNHHVETVIVATHDMQLVVEWANRIIVMHNGMVLHDGTRETVFGNLKLLEQAGLSAPQILELSRKLKMNPLCYTVDEFVEKWIDEQRGNYANGACSQAIG